MLSGDSGKSVAAHPELVKQFQDLVEQDLPLSAKADEAKTLASNLMATLKAAQEDPAMPRAHRRNSRSSSKRC